MKNIIIITVLSIIFICGSCVSRKKLTYLHYSDNETGLSEAQYFRYSITPSAYKIMPNDYLFIRVLTPDPQWSALFNMQQGEGSITMESAALSSYSVDIDGDIEIPYVGKVRVVGKTIPEIKSQLDTVFKSYVTDAVISVRLVENNISIIGEVSVPGRYPIIKDRMTVFDALALAGDISSYGNRQEIKLVRPSPYGPVIKEFSLSDRSILTSELYYIMPNDILYVSPLKARSFQVNSAVWTLFLTTLTSAFGIIAFFRTL